jgi:hypothetical protein
VTDLVLNILRCGAFVLVPVILLGGGIWGIVHFVGMEGRLAFILGATLIGITFFATALVGMAIDPRLANFGLGYVLRTAGLIGLGAFGAAFVFTPILKGLMGLFK